MRRALVVWGGWNGHTPKESVDVFIPWLREQGFDVRVSETLDAYLDAAAMGELSLVVQNWTMGQITREQEKGLSDAVAAGVGLVGWHGGIIDSFRQNTGYQWMTGGQWVAHPGGCIPSYRVNIVDRHHAATKGVADFDLPNTEQYYIHVDPGCHVLCTTTFSGQHGEKDRYPAGTVMPYAYTRGWGKGRVFVACWGHTFKDFDVPQAREIVQRGMLWAAR
jgi:type 1 glutamine amidotransferase